ncbi:glycerol-3-phosphate acyltransferase [Bacillus suaedaesalsae]|uniref:Glycerol-3-phosphate acyltransferase n=1 Tax=Bacillus suaedaesalsae TaxID=2810349 RepID=A0ABS2DHF6_9BACI|nr:glycerol-3-phosphate acyltransferase [Bacillus suaedaesalsae]MBM6617914.1 glycerol-3-phosphate acyltransferase [Bacillus suaedaesalsae]
MLEVLYIIAAYLVGNIMTAFIVMRIKNGGDIRQLGSGNVGARNVGRLIGKKGFLITAIGDGLKGVLVIGGAKYLDFSVEVQLLSMLAVIVGHIWPFTLKFKGGLGIATFIGALLTFHPVVTLVFVIIFLIFLLILRSVTLAAMSGFALIPIILLYITHSITSFILMGIVVAIMIFVHWDGIKEKLE